MEAVKICMFARREQIPELGSLSRLASVSPCSTRASSSSGEGSRPVSGRSIVSSRSTSSLPKLEVEIGRQLTRASSSSELNRADDCKLPTVSQPLLVDSSQKIVRRQLRRSTNGASEKIPTRRRSCPEHPVSKELRQVEAIKSLVDQFEQKKSLEDIMHCLCRHVLKHDGRKAFTQNCLKHYINSVLNASPSPRYDSSVPSTGQEPKSSVGSIAVRVLRALAFGENLQFSDVAGQILCHFLKADALSDRLMQTIAKDLTWIDLSSSTKEKPTELVEKVFHQNAKEDNHLNEREFLKLMDVALESYTAQVNGVTEYTGTRASCRKIELVQKFYEKARHHSTGKRGVTCNGFKGILLKLAHDIGVHPTSLFLAVGRLVV